MKANMSTIWKTNKCDLVDNLNIINYRILDNFVKLN